MIHSRFMAGFTFQKECKDEYTEQESSRKYAYEALVQTIPQLRFGNQMNLYLIFLVPIFLVLFMTLYMRDLSITIKSPDGSAKLQTYSGYFYLGIAIIVGLVIILQKVIFNTSSMVRMFLFLDEKNCYEDEYLFTEQHQHRIQSLVISLIIIFSIALYFLQNKIANWIQNPNPGLQPGGFGKMFFEKTVDKNYFIYGMLGICFLAIQWIYKMTNFYPLLNSQVLCSYPEKIQAYKLLLQQYIAKKENYDAVKKIIEQTYLRVHKSYPDVNQSNIDDYVYYLMHARGRELESLPDAPELIDIKNFMLQLRSDSTFEATLRSFIQWCVRYFLLQFAIILFIAFHYLYKLYPISVSYTIIIGTIVVAFIASWYSWFDTVFVV